MKKNIISFIIILLCLIVSCDAGSKTPSSGSTGSLISLSDLSEYRAEISNAKSIGIQTYSRGITKGDIVSRSVSRGERQEYLVVSDSYSDNNGNISPVKFTRVQKTDTPVEGRKDNVFADEKGKDGIISFFADSAFTYSVLYQDQVVLEGITDNGPMDQSSLEGVIEVAGLTPGHEYSVVYKGNGKEVTITQDDLNGMIDKVYVSGNYTFISFVGLNSKQRPSAESMSYGTDGISNYDKTGYSTSSTRKSFIIDNSTGLIYPITGFEIDRFEGGCIRTDDPHTVYDFRINENSDLEIFPVLNNDSISISHVMKDRYGNIFIGNDRINGYYPETKTYFYTLETNGDYTRYAKTEKNEVISIKRSASSNYEASIVQADGTTRKLTTEDTFTITDYMAPIAGYLVTPYKAEKGLLFLGTFNKDSWGNHENFTICNYMYVVDCVNNTQRSMAVNGQYFEGSSSILLKDYDIMLRYDGNHTLYAYYNVMQKLSESLGNYYYSSDIKSICEEITVNANCSLSDDRNSLLTYGPFGNTYYDIGVTVNASGSPEIKLFEVGTYQKPQLKIVFQPINR